MRLIQKRDAIATAESVANIGSNELQNRQAREGRFPEALARQPEVISQGKHSRSDGTGDLCGVSGNCSKTFSPIRLMIHFGDGKRSLTHAEDHRF